MSILSYINAVRFLWDARKATANLKKHGVSFEEAVTAFEDELGAYYPDSLYDDRFILIGYSRQQRLLYVVHAEVAATRSGSSAHERRPDMKKRATKTTDPLDGPVDFTRFGPMRRNAFAGAGEAGGPSLQALWEMPQLGASAVLLRRGRPRRGSKRTTVVRSVRLPEDLWLELERAARSKHLNLHQAMRAALLGWIRHVG
jgi:uncharacterized DUF497 family protein